MSGLLPKINEMWAWDWLPGKVIARTPKSTEMPDGTYLVEYTFDVLPDDDCRPDAVVEKPE